MNFKEIAQTLETVLLLDICDDLESHQREVSQCCRKHLNRAGELAYTFGKLYTIFNREVNIFLRTRVNSTRIKLSMIAFCRCGVSDPIYGQMNDFFMAINHVTNSSETQIAWLKMAAWSSTTYRRQKKPLCIYRKQRTGQPFCNTSIQLS